MLQIQRNQIEKCPAYSSMRCNWRKHASRKKH